MQIKPAILIIRVLSETLWSILRSAPAASSAPRATIRILGKASSASTSPFPTGEQWWECCSSPGRGFEDEIQSWGEEDTQVTLRACPQLTTFLAKGVHCLSALHVPCWTLSQPWGMGKPQLGNLSEVTGGSDPLFSLRKALCTVFLLPLSTPHHFKTAGFSDFGMYGNYTQQLGSRFSPKIVERQKRALGPLVVARDLALSLLFHWGRRDPKFKPLWSTFSIAKEQSIESKIPTPVCVHRTWIVQRAELGKGLD